jgi:23S rRNA pseudouridine1911/1915/1917 synthase
MKLTVPSPMTLLEALNLLAPESTKTAFRSWLKEGRVLLDNKVVKNGTTTAVQGQVVFVGPKPRFLEKGIKILYEDRHLVVVDKPEGLLSVSTAFEKEETIHAFLKKKYRPKPVYVVHRLDQDTSGVMVFALTPEANEIFKKNFEKHDIERSYIAIVEGHLEESSGTWRSYLVEDPNYVVKSASNPQQGRLAVTHFSQIGMSKWHTALELKLETGRKNQIRVHCQNSGHSIAGDKKYGAKTNPLKRLGLHANLLAFVHPITKKEMRFTSQIPECFNRFLN